eukprot:1147305-Pelagomonas_calceolata.AAC.4
MVYEEKTASEPCLVGATFCSLLRSRVAARFLSKEIQESSLCRANKWAGEWAEYLGLPHLRGRGVFCCSIKRREKRVNGDQEGY